MDAETLKLIDGLLGGYGLEVGSVLILVPVINWVTNSLKDMIPGMTGRWNLVPVMILSTVFSYAVAVGKVKSGLVDEISLVAIGLLSTVLFFAAAGKWAGQKALAHKATEPPKRTPLIPPYEE